MMNEYVVYDGIVMSYDMYKKIRESEGYVFPEEEVEMKEETETEEEEETE